MNEGLRGLGTGMGPAAVRQRLLEAQVAQERAFARLGEVVHAGFVQDGPDAVRPDFLAAVQDADSVTRAVLALQTQLDSVLAAQNAPVTTFCGACGTPMVSGGAFCPSCGAPTA